MNHPFRGVIVPMLTPLNADETLDRAAVDRLVRFLLEAGVDALFILGSNGEGATLRPAVQHDMIETTLNATAGRVPVMVGVLETSTMRVIERIRELSSREISAFVVTTPLYYTSWLGEIELFAHFTAIAAESQRPILLYNIPQMTGMTLTTDLINRLAVSGNVAGLKDSSGDWGAFKRLLTARPSPDFALLQGQQSLSVESLLLGGDGLIPGYANVYPQLLVDLSRAALRGEIDLANVYQARLDELLRIRGRALLHANKTVGKALGLMEDHVTAPLPRLSPAEARHFLSASVAAGLALDLKESDTDANRTTHV